MRHIWRKKCATLLITLGWTISKYHEDANGQFEMNWNYTDSLGTADRHVFFKFMVKSIAEKHGLRATFMPKPFEDLTGNGCHAHISLWNGSNNLFLDKGDKLGLSKLAYNFLGGILNSAEALSAFLILQLIVIEELMLQLLHLGLRGHQVKYHIQETIEPT
jgi:glutamine synthetase